MIYKIITVDDLGMDLRKKVEEDPAYMYTIQKIASVEYTTGILKIMAEHVKQLCKTHNPEERNRLLKIIAAYKDEYDEVNDAIDKLKKDEGA